LIHFRSGDVQLGREWYQRALSKVTGADKREERARVLIHLAREEVIAGSSMANVTFKEMLDTCKGEKDANLRGMLERLQSVILTRPAEPSDSESILAKISELMGEAKPVAKASAGWSSSTTRQLEEL
jgi:hypothetical protein